MAGSKRAAKQLALPCFDTGHPPDRDELIARMALRVLGRSRRPLTLVEILGSSEWAELRPAVNLWELTSILIEMSEAGRLMRCRGDNALSRYSIPSEGDRR